VFAVDVPLAPVLAAALAAPVLTLPVSVPAVLAPASAAGAAGVVPAGALSPPPQAASNSKQGINRAASLARAVDFIRRVPRLRAINSDRPQV
jgi:hypothetical protein